MRARWDVPKVASGSGCKQEINCKVQEHNLSYSKSALREKDDLKGSWLAKHDFLKTDLGNLRSKSIVP